MRPYKTWAEDGGTQLDFPGGHNTIAFGINNHDDIVGVFTNAAASWTTREALPR